MMFAIIDFIDNTQQFNSAIKTTRKIQLTRTAVVKLRCSSGNFHESIFFLIRCLFKKLYSCVWTETVRICNLYI